MNQELQGLIDLFSRLPGFGVRSARRIVVYLMSNIKYLQQLHNKLLLFERDIKRCKICNNMDFFDECTICKKRSHETICVVQTVTELWAIERASCFNGVYHVLGGNLSAVDGITPEDLHFESLWSRLGKVKEVVIAFSMNIDSQITLNYLLDRLRRWPVIVSVLSHGVPMGADLDYIDDETMRLAIYERKQVL